MAVPSLDLRLKKVNKIYHEGEVVAGVVVIQSKSDIQHQGVTLTMDGTVNLQLSAKSVGLFEAFYNSLKPIPLLNVTLEVAKPGRLPSGKTEIPFEIPLKTKQGKKLYETYHGVFVNIQYLLKVDMKRSLLNKDVQKQCEFIVEYKDNEEKAVCKPMNFTISPDTLQNVKEKHNVPAFKLSGKLDSTVCCISKPLSGEESCSQRIATKRIDSLAQSCYKYLMKNKLTVVQSEAPIKSIELQLVRVETCGCAEGYAKDATEIQNIQIADGDVCRGITIPIYMVFPRLFTCPTLYTNNFKIEFEVNIVTVFYDDHLVTENFPIKLTRF